MSDLINRPFPRPPTLIAALFEDLSRIQILTDMLSGRNGDTAAQELEQFGDLDLLPRPWDPPTCAPKVREQLWQWLDDVVAWFNHDYAWKVERAIPSCWPAHPHLAHELALLACLRWQATTAMTPDPMEEWHRWAVPSFIDRMHTQIGQNGCPPGKHTPWPAKTRFDHYEDPQHRSERDRMFSTDASANSRSVRGFDGCCVKDRV